MSETPFIITIDAEGDDLWASPREITTRNAEYLPRFQSLCERFRFKPVYLTNYEMAMSGVFVEFARDVVARGAGEIGMHLHAWNSPPLVPLTSDDFRFHPYLIEYPKQAMKEKIRTLTCLLEDRFDQKMVSHRAGRWGFDGSAFPDRPYFLSPSNISLPATSVLLEVPMTTRLSGLYRRAGWAYRIPLLRRVVNKLSRGVSWMYPAENKLDAMLQVARGARADGAAHVEFMLHSSELMPGGSPSFRNASDIERLYESLETLFEDLSTWCRGTTLKEFHTLFSNGERLNDPH